jgi:hypothetical protein
MTERLCKYCGGWHDLDLPWPHNCRPPEPQRSDLTAPMVISDVIMDGVQSMVDGKMYTSKARLRASYKAHGVIEVGNDPARLRPFKRPKPDRKKIRESLEKAVAKVGRGDVREEVKHKL